MQTKMDPCFYKMVSCKVASVCKFGTDLNAPCLSFRCRSPGAHVARYFFTIHSYFLLSRSGRGSWLAEGQTEGASARLRPAAHYFFPLHFYLLLLLGSPCGGAGTAQP